MKIISLAENTCKSGLYGTEHGLSLYIETEKHKILFDMGQSELFCENAKKLGVRIEDVDIAILSHGHYDHGGGLEKFLAVNNKSTVYISPYAFEPHYNSNKKFIGIDASLQGSSRIAEVWHKTEIDDGITLYPAFLQKDICNNATQGMFARKSGEIVEDDFSHEQYLIIEENGKRTLFSGCSHRGILNIVNWFEADYIIGGFHFSKYPADESLKEYATILSKYPSFFYTCHCTGTCQYEYMKKYIKRLEYLSTGDIIYI